MLAITEGNRWILTELILLWTLLVVDIALRMGNILEYVPVGVLP